MFNIKNKWLFIIIIFACNCKIYAKSITLLKEFNSDHTTIWTIDEKKFLSLPPWNLTDACPFSINQIMKWINDSGKIDIKKKTLRSVRIMLPSESSKLNSKNKIYFCTVVFEEETADDTKYNTFVILSTGEFVEPNVVKQ
jgi:hypothetical protein